MWIFEHMDAEGGEGGSRMETTPFSQTNGSI
jgi:hypothetical protein